jgi:hypothetical protein
VYRNALAPELRSLTDPDRVHRVPDYSGANKEEREARIRQIINIARDNNYNSIFAGYGFMAEDEMMVAAMEAAGLNFIGPCSRTVHDAGLKDEAKRTALKTGVSVTPGIDNGTALTLLKKHPDVAALTALVAEHKLAVDSAVLEDESVTLEDKADIVLAESYAGFDRVAKPCRMIIYTGGALVATKSDGTEVTLPASLAGIPLPIEVWVINGSDAGTTATAALVIW